MITKDKKGISPVITTVIIVAVGIAVAIAVALWMSGLIGIFTRFEKLEITSAWASFSGGVFTVNLNFTNTGSSDTTVTQVMVNGKPYAEWTGVIIAPVEPISAPIGVKTKMVMTIPNNAPSGSARLTSGVTVTITLHTSGGKDYSASVALP